MSNIEQGMSKAEVGLPLSYFVLQRSLFDIRYSTHCDVHDPLAQLQRRTLCNGFAEYSFNAARFSRRWEL
ncbi:MAG: hypothetical protein CMJ64_25640 [Planctomycetaceae bacterium]|nr:hypothetical protein [Planctomycetaceae bacterium]